MCILAFAGVLSLLVQAQAPASQAPPSQFELNGFILEQSSSDIAGAFPRLFRADTTNDGWIYRTYIVDRATGSYMSFKFPSGSVYAIAIQIAGGPSTPMRPFLGLRLGAPSPEIVAALGPPSSTRRLPDWPAVSWAYDGRNYSLEVDTLGRLSSIQIFGYDGIPDSLQDTLPDLKALHRALANRDVDAVLSMVAPDLELRWKGQPLHYGTSARQAVSDTASAFAQALFGPTPSVLAVLSAPGSMDQGTRELRGERTRTIRYRPQSTIEYPTLVFVAYVGAWRLWEADFGP
jgi:hypothetical protein